MNAAWFALAAAFAALSVVFFARSGRSAGPAAGRGARLVCGLFLAAALLFLFAGAVAMFKD